MEDLSGEKLDLDEHERKVTKISTDLKYFHERKIPFRIYHGSTNSTRQSSRQRDHVIDTSFLKNILGINHAAKTVFAEPNVPMDMLVVETLKHGLLPPVVMEFPGITVGGGFSGTAGESSSFRHGFFNRTVKLVQIVLGNGDVVLASSTLRSDLFSGAACSFGTLGVVTLVALELTEATRYVSLTYVRVRAMDEAINLIERAEKDSSLDYLDGIFFAKDHGLLCLGRLSDQVQDSYPIMRFARPWDQWFYRSAEKLSKKQDSWTEAVPIIDYLFRYDRGGFWVGKYAFHYFLVPFNRVTRLILDPLMYTRIMYNALHHSGHAQRYIVQDVAIPYDKSSEFLDYLEKEFRHYPIWLCPLRLRGKSNQSARGLLADDVQKPGTSPASSQSEPDMMLNFGVWGLGPEIRRDFVDWNRRFEQKVQSLGGKKWLYAHVYYTEDEFWSIYNQAHYSDLRKKYHAEYLPNIYDKVKVDWRAEEERIQSSWLLWLSMVFWNIWPLSGLYGVVRAAFGSEYLLLRRREFWQNLLSLQETVEIEKSTKSE